MKDEYLHLDLLKNEKEQRFEMKTEEAMAIINYKQTNDKISLVHTEVPAALEGKGIATAITEKTLQYIEKNNLKLIPLCPFVAAYVKRHPEWKKVLEKT